MKRLLNAAWIVLSSRALTPVVCAIFLLTYIGIAFSTEEALTALMEVTRQSVILVILLALIPLNSACRILAEIGRNIARYRALHGERVDLPVGLFDETVEMGGSPSPAALQSRLDAVGYKTHHADNVVAAWRGVSVFPARLLFLIGTLCLFTGILISLTARTAHRMAVVEGQPLPTAKGGGGLVERVSLGTSTGLILDKTLAIEVAPSESGDARKTFGLYPPSLYRGYFVYPRYLGFAPVIRFSAPDLPAYETRSTLNIYPAGREDGVEIPNSPYRVVLSMAQPDDGSDPYASGRISYIFKLLKGKELLFTGSVPAGGEFVRDGYRLAIPESSKMVTTDFIRDYGVMLIWMASLLFVAAWCIWLPVRVCIPRCEMLFTFDQDMLRASSRAEGRRRTHAGVFHETLDHLESTRHDTPGPS
jgi:hypothetical protein